MDTNTETTPEQEPDIVIHSVESDLEALNKSGETIEPMSTESAPVEEEQKVEEPIKTEPKKSRSQRRIERLAKENQELKERLETKAPEPKVETEPEEVDIDKFDNYDDYLQAVQDSKAKEPVEEKEEKPEEKPKLPYSQSAIDELMGNGADEYPDFTELIQAEDLALSVEMLGDILESENGSDVAYYLATHKDETAKIAGMTPKQMSRELIKIEMKLDGKPVKRKVKQSKAPEPITPVDGQGVLSKQLGDDNLSFAEHEALLNESRVNNAGGFL